MELQFRKCVLRDLEQLVYISRVTFSAAFQEDNDPEDFQVYLDRAFSEQKIKQELLNKNSVFYFVDQEEDVVAYLKLNENTAQTEFKDPGAIELERVYVLAEYQGKGIGAGILKFVLELAQKKEKDYIWLGVWERNEKAFRFYLRHGFQKFGSHDFYIGKDKQTDWLLKLQL